MKSIDTTFPMAYLFILLLLFPLSTTAQHETGSPDLPFELGIEETNEKELNEALHPDRKEQFTSLWTDYNFTEDPGYSILVHKPGLGQDEYYYVTDAKILQSYQGEYVLLSKAIDPSCEYDYSPLLLVNNKQVVEMVYVYWECGVLASDLARPFQADLNQLLIGAKKIAVDTREIENLSRYQVDMAVNKAMGDSSIVLCQPATSKKLKIRLVFEGGADKLQQVYTNEFYSEVMLKKVNALKEADKRYQNVSEENIIVEQLARQYTKAASLQLESWATQQENSKNLLLTVHIYPPQKKGISDLGIKYWDLSTYSLTTATLKTGK